MGRKEKPQAYNGSKERPGRDAGGGVFVKMLLEGDKTLPNE